jgi:hypothetical protein
MYPYQICDTLKSKFLQRLANGMSYRKYVLDIFTLQSMEISEYAHTHACTPTAVKGSPTITCQLDSGNHAGFKELNSHYVRNGRLQFHIFGFGSFGKVFMVALERTPPQSQKANVAED